MSLNKEEIKQLHDNFMIFRKCKLMGKIPFVIRSYIFSEEGEFVKIFDEIDSKDDDVFIRNFVVENILKNVLVSFNDEIVDKENIKNFSSEKSNYIVNEYNKLTADIEEYFKGYENKPLTEEEIEEFILTDKIERTVSFDIGEEDISPIKVKYKLLNLEEHKQVGKLIKEDVKELKIKTKAHMEYIREFNSACAIIDSINGIQINKENIGQFNIELIKFILQRATTLEKEITDFLNNPKEIGETLKN